MEFFVYEHLDSDMVKNKTIIGLKSRTKLQYPQSCEVKNKTIIGLKLPLLYPRGSNIS